MEDVKFAINKQANSFFAFLNDLSIVAINDNTENYNDVIDIAIDLILYWSYQGYKEYNIGIFNQYYADHISGKSIGIIAHYIKLHCDWTMVYCKFWEKIKGKPLTDEYYRILFNPDNKLTALYENHRKKNTENLSEKYSIKKMIRKLLNK